MIGTLDLALGSGSPGLRAGVYRLSKEQGKKVNSRGTRSPVPHAMVPERAGALGRCRVAHISQGCAVSTTWQLQSDACVVIVSRPLDAGPREPAIGRRIMSMIKDLFRESPFEPLRYHMKSVMECVAFVRPMFEAVRDAQYDKLQELARKVFKVEHTADMIKDDIRQTIPKRFFLPVYRGDLLGSVKLQDDMADSVEDIAVLLTIKHLPLPSQLVEPAFEYVAKIEDVCQRTQAIADYLPTLVEGDMVGAEAEHALAMVADVEKAEWEADRLQYSLSQALFALEDEMKPTDIFLWFRVFGELGQLANFAEKTGDRLRRMLST